MADKNEPKRELTIKRTFNAPRELVWRAWTDPELVRKWWGPRGVTNPTCEVDARSGGRINIVMLAGKELGSAKGMKWPMIGKFKEVTPQKRLVIAAGAADEVQGIFLETEVAVDFEEVGGKTRMNLHIVVTKINKTDRAMFALKGMGAGWTQSIDKLQETLAVECLV
jgi:uncharacterized protein YndB with AHSA1/START domain